MEELQIDMKDGQGQPKLRVFIAGHCKPCQELKEMAENGILGDVEVIDLETEEGFQYFEKMDITGVPSIYRDGVKCSISYTEDESIEIICPDEVKDGSDKEVAD